MNVASRPLCQQLYELSGWDGTADWYREVKPGKWTIIDWDEAGDNDIPAYDAGYLLRRLPNDIIVKKLEDNKGYRAYAPKTVPMPSILADTPEDALALLAIELLKQGVITG